jgi:2-C-methyl-D-erythritol 4-phosphate cytidylyltransferase
MRGSVAAIVVAAGRSERMGRADKLWTSLPSKNGREEPLIAHALSAFQKSRKVDRGVLVVAEDAIPQSETMLAEHGFSKFSVVAGGGRRQDSVLAGLEAAGQAEWAVIHDGARPLVTVDLIEDSLRAAQATGASCCAIPIPDTVKEGVSGRIIRTLDRSRLWLAQTPQTFRYDLLLDAHKRTSADVTDDAALVEALGVEVRICEGSRRNIKVTTPEDLDLVAALLS